MAGKSSSEQTGTAGWHASREVAPSTVKADDPRLARILGLVGLFLAAVGAMILVLRARGAGSFNPAWGVLSSVVGTALLLFHAALDGDVQIRRTYGMLGYLWIAAAAFSLIPFRGTFAEYFVPYGVASLFLGLLFLMPFARNETEEVWHRAVLRVLGGTGALMAVVGFVGGTANQDFLLGGTLGSPFGVLLILLGFAYLWAFVILVGPASEVGFRASVGFGLLGALAVVVALGRSAVPGWFYSWGWLTSRPLPYLIPSGIILALFGALYTGLAATLTMDNKLVVLFRRELAGFFYSPIAYFVLFSYAAIASILFLMFVSQISVESGMGGSTEPVIAGFLVSWFALGCLLVAVPVLTMKLLSEEQRTGSLEVLLTAPLGEVQVVLSKFLAVLVFFMLVWAPWGVCLVALRIGGGAPFEYRPAISFYLMWLVCGASFLSMGIFFSSLTRNQIIAAVMTFMGMLILTVPYWIKELIAPRSGGIASTAAWEPILNHLSFIELWIQSIYGEITPKFYLFPISCTIFWLFLTVKVLESRRWR